MTGDSGYRGGELVLEGRWRVVGLLGRGGMAEVWLARDLTGGPDVAVKILGSAGAPSPTWIRRFQREFRACARLDHPNVVHVHGGGQTPEGAFYYVMDYMPWGDLAQLLAERGSLPEEQTLTYAAQLTDAFAHFHGQGVVHRDLKPANIMLAPDGRLVVTDFGLALDDRQTRLTATGSILGTPLYMSPELLMGTGADEGSDVFQFGLIVYEMLTGRKLLQGKTLPEIAVAVSTRMPSPIAEVVPGCRPGWDGLLAGCLARDATLRFRSGDELSAVLERVRQGLPVKPPGAAPVPVGAEPSTLALSTPDPGSSASRSSAPSGPRRLAAVAVLALVSSFMVWLRLTGEGAMVHDVSNLRVCPVAGGLEARWTSSTPYPSRVVLRDGRGVERVSSDATSRPTTAHVVLVADLAADEGYHVSVLFPSGERSLAQRVVLERPRIQDLRPRLEGDALFLSVSLSPGLPPPVVVEAGSPAGLARSNLSGCDGRRVDVRIPGAAGELRGLRLLGAGGLAVDLGSWLDGRTAELSGALDRFQPSQIAPRVEAGMAPSMNHYVEDSQVSLNADLEQRWRSVEEGEPRVRAQVVDFVDATGLRDEYEEAVELSPLILGTRLLALSRRCELLERLQRFVSLEILAANNRVDLPPFPEPSWGAWRSSLQSPPAPPDGVVELALGVDLLELGPRRPLLGQFYLPSWEARVAVDGVDTVTGAALILNADRFRGSLLRCTVGDLPPFLIQDPRRRGAGPEGFHEVVQQIPRESLREGQNLVRLEYAAALSQVDRRAVRLRGVKLVLWRSRREATPARGW